MPVSKVRLSMIQFMVEPAGRNIDRKEEESITPL